MGKKTKPLEPRRVIFQPLQHLSMDAISLWSKLACMVGLSCFNNKYNNKKIRKNSVYRVYGVRNPFTQRSTDLSSWSSRHCPATQQTHPSLVCHDVVAAMFLGQLWRQDVKAPAELWEHHVVRVPWGPEGAGQEGQQTNRTPWPTFREQKQRRGMTHSDWITVYQVSESFQPMGTEGTWVFKWYHYIKRPFRLEEQRVKS